MCVEPQTEFTCKNQQVSAFSPRVIPILLGGEEQRNGKEDISDARFGGDSGGSNCGHV